MATSPQKRKSRDSLCGLLLLFADRLGSNSYYRESQISRPKCVYIAAVAVCRLYGESKDAAGIQDEQSEDLERFKQSGRLFKGSRTLSRFGVVDEQIYLVIHDRFPAISRIYL